MTHGYTIAVAVGRCPVCHRDDAPLRPVAAQPDRLVCLDEFACFDAWVRLDSRQRRTDA